MSCGHCASAVREEIAKVSGVTAVDVDMTDGKVTIESAGPLDSDAIENAVDEAGYHLAR
ncbi:heavy-metal-associated domain protein [Mycobacterium xenopi 4042]|nr:heavy-metal-associated domain protein [Mycobacterium xenopi 4042]